MGTTESHLSYRLSDAVIKEIIINKDTIVVVSTPETVQIFEHWYASGKITDVQPVWLVVAGKNSYISTSWFEAGSEVTEQGKYRVKIGDVKAPTGICLQFAKSCVPVSIMIAGSWHPLRKNYKVSCVGNEIRLT